MNQKITPCLWFDGNAKEAVDYYLSLFPDSKILDTSYYPKSTEEGLGDFQKDLAGEVLTINFELSGYRFTALNAGSEFKLNQSISFMVNFDKLRDKQAMSKIDELWAGLLDGGKVIMPLDKYPYSERYGWVKDRYGVTWQLIVIEPEDKTINFIMPSLMFSGENANHTEEAINFYTSVFKDAKLGMLARYEEDRGPARAGSLMYADFTLSKQWFAAMDSGADGTPNFNEAISLVVTCKDQAEIDYFWDKLSSVPEAEQCGWCKDKFGLSWQIIPESLGDLMSNPGAFAKLMEMKKLVIAEFSA